MMIASFGRLVCAALLFAVGLSSAGAAESYPTRPVHIVVGFGAGSAADLTARVVAQRLSETMGQRFIVENKPGAGSTLAAEQVLRAPKDGYTVFLSTVANVINDALQSNLPFDFGKDFEPITLATSSALVLVAYPSIGISTVQDLVSRSKQEPGKILFASSGVGTAPHLSGELFNMLTGGKMVHVPYQGSGQAMTDLLAGRTQVMFSPVSTALPHIKSGALKGIATTESKRSSELPDLPTVAEAGVKGFDTSLWLAFSAPAGVPKDVIGRLSDGINEALKDPGTASALQKAGLEINGGSPAEFRAFIVEESKKWKAVVNSAGLRK